MALGNKSLKISVNFSKSLKSVNLKKSIKILKFINLVGNFTWLLTPCYSYPVLRYVSATSQSTICVCKIYVHYAYVTFTCGMHITSNVYARNMSHIIMTLISITVIVQISATNIDYHDNGYWCIILPIPYYLSVRTSV